MKSVGKIRNTTDHLLGSISVKIYLSNGVELHPTKPRGLPAGGWMEVRIQTGKDGFERWSAHAEVGN
ncbi:MAG: hypothetical protein OEV00_15290 [Acidobacteriota bacterium]|nr:hypothetical protein [Acidobacteriota bacterium]MDH3786675.1 hypothetical protein [Acidobacteriota bacterium]